MPSKQRARVSVMLDETHVHADTLGLVIADEDGRTITSLHGDPLAEWVHGCGGISSKTYYF